jgi:hypothetical protein
MPVGPEVIDKLFDQDAVNALFEAVDTKLSDPRWVSNNQCGDHPNYYWDVIHPVTLNQAGRDHVLKEYKAAGWPVVEVHNSGDKGERPGLTRVRLGKSA